MESFIYKNFTDCSNAELAMILKWRNSDDVRFNSYNSDIISLENHLNFVKTLGCGDSQNRYYFLISDDEGYVGVLSFTNFDDKSGEIGYYKNSQRTEKGIGVKLLNFAAILGKNFLKLDELITTVFEFNAASIITMERSGFAQQIGATKPCFIERTGKTSQLFTYKRKL